MAGRATQVPKGRASRAPQLRRASAAPLVWALGSPRRVPAGPGPVWAVAPHEHAGADEGPGDFRRQDIQPSGSGMTPPTWPTVGAEVRAWVQSACRLADGEGAPWPERVARVHASFERVHPFIDGNGRTGRLALNLLLVRLGYPPAIVLKQQRPSYLASLAKADQGDDGPLGEIVARAITDDLNRFIIPSVAGPARLVPLQALVTADVTLTALRHAARRGRSGRPPGGRRHLAQLSPRR